MRQRKRNRPRPRTSQPGSSSNPSRERTPPGTSPSHSSVSASPTSNTPRTSAPDGQPSSSRNHQHLARKTTRKTCANWRRAAPHGSTPGSPGTCSRNWTNRTNWTNRRNPQQNPQTQNPSAQTAYPKREEVSPQATGPENQTNPGNRAKLENPENRLTLAPQPGIKLLHDLPSLLGLRLPAELHPTRAP